MKKLINKLREKDIDVMLIIIFLLLLMPIFLKPLLVEDELWNFAFIYKMKLGYIPYKDLNIIVTPLFHIIGLLLFYVLGQANYLAFKIYGFVINFTFLLLVFKIFKNLKVNKTNSVIYVWCISLLMMSIFAAGANYNILVLVPIFIFILLTIKNYENFYIYGLLVFITFLIKQNVGIYFGIGMLLFIIVNKKNIISNIIKILLSNIILLIIFVFILYKCNILYDFINITVLGMQEFGMRNIAVDINLLYIALDIVLIAFSIIVILKSEKLNISDKTIKNSKTILCIGAPLLLISYPIFNYNHIILGSIIILINAIYLLDETFFKYILEKKVSKIIVFILLFVVLFLGLKNGYNVISQCYVIKDNKSPYYGSWIDEEIEKKMNNINKFIDKNESENIKILILSDSANLYFLPRNENNNIFDLAFFGNMGKEGENGLLNEIKSLKNTKILITSEETDACYQESQKAKNYIKENYKKSETIENFDVYYIKN